MRATLILIWLVQALRSIWSLEISYNPQLGSLQGSFPQLQIVGYGSIVNITGNTGLTSLPAWRCAACLSCLHVKCAGYNHHAEGHQQPLILRKT